MSTLAKILIFILLADAFITLVRHHTRINIEYLNDIEGQMKEKIRISSFIAFIYGFVILIICWLD